MFNHKAWIAVLALSVGATAPLKANEQELTETEKVIVKSFPAHATTSVEVVNKYGNVHVNTWDKDSVKFRIHVKGKAKKYEDAEMMVASTEFSIGGSTSFITAQTALGKNVPWIKQGISDLKREFGVNKVEVNYEIWMPATNKLSINNRFGDIYLPVMEGDLRVIVNHGDLRIKKVKEAKKLEMYYGTMTIEEIEEGNIHVQYSDLIIEEAGELSLHTNSSDVNIEEVDQLAIESKHDKYMLEEVNRITGECNLSHIKVKKLAVKIDLTTRYGSVIVSKVAADFRRVNLTGEYTDYTLNFDEFGNYNFDVILDDGRDFSYPMNGVKVLSDSTFAESSRAYSGTGGKGSDSAQVRIRTRNSYVKFDYY